MENLFGGSAGASAATAGGSAGGSAALATLMDGFSNGLTVEALNRSREGITDPADTRHYTWPTVPVPDAIKKLARWEPWVRNSLMQGELLAGLSFTSGVQGALKLHYDNLGYTLITMRRPPDSLFEQQVDDVLSYAALRQDRNAEILSQIDGQFPFWQAVFPTRLTQLSWTQEIITAVTQLCVFVEMRFKHEFACRRPSEMSPQVQPMITTPGHGTYPMGHATQIFAVRRILRQLLRDATGQALPANLERQLHELALRMSENRIVAGVHFPADLVGGAVLGELIGACAYARFVKGDVPVLIQPDFDVQPAFAASVIDLKAFIQKAYLLKDEDDIERLLPRPGLPAAAGAPAPAAGAAPQAGAEGPLTPVGERRVIASSPILDATWKAAVLQLQQVGGWV